MIEFFENLKNKRIEHNKDLRDISEKTKLNLNILTAIENGELEKLPKGYRRIYLRRYIKEIGLDPDTVMKDYDLLVGDADVEAIKEDENALSKRTIDKKKRNFHEYRQYIKPAIGIFSIVGIIIIMAIGLKNLIGNENQLEVKEVTANINVKLDTLIKDEPVPQPVISPQAAQQYVETSDNVVEVVAKKRSWIKQIMDIKDTLEYIIPEGQIKKFHFKESVKFIIGRGDGIKLIINGREFDNLAPEGIVIRRLVIDKYGIVSKLLAKPKIDTVKTDTINTAVRDSI
ncbi:MAG: hypothetical protein Kow00108_06310 [Calditrichia bacterium]